MACVPEGKPIGLWEMKEEDWTKFKRKDGGPAKGIGAEYPPPLHQGDKGGGEENAGVRPHRHLAGQR